MTPGPPLWIGVATVFTLGVAALGAAMVLPAVPLPPVTEPAPGASPPAVSPRSALTDSAAALVVARDLFRRSRRPAASPSRSATPATPAAPAVRRPTLRLVGLVVGPDGAAVIEGLPGAEGARVVREGDVIGNLRIRRITHAGVHVSGMDTVWVLTVREPWR